MSQLDTALQQQSISLMLINRRLIFKTSFLAYSMFSIFDPPLNNSHAYVIHQVVEFKAKQPTPTIGK